MRVVVDPNVLVAAAITNGVSAQLLDHWMTVRPFEIIVCPMLLSELRDVLGRDQFRRWITQAEATLLLERLEQEAESRRDPVDIPQVGYAEPATYLRAATSDRHWLTNGVSTRQVARARREASEGQSGLIVLSVVDVGPGKVGTFVRNAQRHVHTVVQGRELLETPTTLTCEHPDDELVVGQHCFVAEAEVHRPVGDDLPAVAQMFLQGSYGVVGVTVLALTGTSHIRVTELRVHGVHLEAAVVFVNDLFDGRAQYRPELFLVSTSPKSTGGQDRGCHDHECNQLGLGACHVSSITVGCSDDGATGSDRALTISGSQVAGSAYPVRTDRCRSLEGEGCAWARRDGSRPCRDDDRRRVRTPQWVRG